MSLDSTGPFAGPSSCVLLKYGELTLKGNNRRWFQERLLANLRRAAGSVSAPVQVWHRGGLLVLASAAPREELLACARRVMGVSVIQPALRVPKTPQAAAAGAVQAIRDRMGTSDPAQVRPTFAIRARRRNKDFPMSSADLASYLGQHLRDLWGWPVDLSHPDLTVWVEVDEEEVFVTCERERGPGGLPVGCSGHALALLSGGYDSPVAAHRAMRRGLRCDFLHFTGAPYTGPASTYKAYALARRLDGFQSPARLHVVPIGPAQRALATAGAGRFQIVAQRRLMMRIAAVVARRRSAEALVTGDSLGQVSSQTLSNLATVEEACDLPLLRPLLGWDKEEIIAEARDLGTAEISALTDEDCCTMLTPPRVATSTTPGQMDPVDRRAGIDDLVASSLERMQVIPLGQELAAQAGEGSLPWRHGAA